MSQDFPPWLLFHIILNFVFSKETCCLKLMKMSVPQLLQRGDSTLLQCQFDLETDRLYSVMWYKDQEEFYRFIPRNNPQQHSYRLDGFRVDHHMSNDHQVLLRNVNLKASGNYRCEVSAEAPSFTSVYGEGSMEVIALPKEGPEISGQVNEYSVGDMMQLNCTSAGSYPPARLSWLVNDQQVTAEYGSVWAQHGLVSTSIALRLIVTRQHLNSGLMVVRCLSSLIGRHRTLDTREALLLVKNGSSDHNSNVFLCFLPLLLQYLTHAWCLRQRGTWVT